MTKKYSTKKALIASVLSLALCFSMLVGTTFAWFTDTAVSAGNIIQTGTLDVEMYWADGAEDVPTDDNGWEDASEGAIFNYDKWEPGYAAVRHIKIANEGTLALKYTVRIVPNGDVSDLADVIDVYYADPAAKVADATALTDANKLGTLTEVLAGLAVTGNGELKADEADTITLALKMQEGAGNEYQNKAIGASFSIQVLATQLASEEDSFDNQYDVDATHPSITTEAVKLDTIIAAGTDAVIATDDIKVVVPAEVLTALPTEVESIAVAYTEPVVDKATNVVTFEAIEIVDQDGKKIDLSTNDKPIAVTLPAQTAIEKDTDVVILHDGVVVASAVVAEDGSISYEAKHFCEVTVFEATAVATAEELVAAVANGGNIQLAADITIAKTLVITKDTAIYGFGKTLTYTGSDRAIDTPNNANAKVNVAINNLTVNCTASYCQRGINYNDDGALDLDGVTVKGANVTYALNLPGLSDYAVVTINNSAFTGNIALNVWGENSVINAKDTVFTSVDTVEAENYTAVSLNSDGSSAAEGAVVNIVGGSIIAYDEKGAPSFAIRNGTVTAVVNVSETTEVVGTRKETVAIVAYEGYNEFYSFTTLQDAIVKAAENTNTTVVLTKDITAENVVTLVDVPAGAKVVLDLNGHNITASLDGSEGWSQIFRINNGASLTVIGEGKVHAVAYPTITYGSVIFNNVGGDLIINGGTYTMTYGSYGEGYLLPAIIDTNSNTAKATTTINGGTFSHTRNMFRNFAQPKRGDANATLNITGGTFIGEADDYATIWNQKTSGSGVEGDGIVNITGGTFTYVDICNDFEGGVTIADGLNIQLQ